MNNQFFCGILLGSLLIPSTTIFADVVGAKPTTKPTKQAKPKPTAKPETKPKPEAEAKPKPAAKAEPEQVVLSSTTIKDSGIRYELTGCKREGDSVVCRLLLTNKKKEDTAVTLKVAGTRFIDRDGEEYKAKKAKVGSVEGDADAENTLIADIPTKASVTFDAPPANVVTMKVLAISHSPGNTLKFRDVKIGKAVGAKPETSKPETAKPEVTKPETAKPEN
jgi:hypothetical protein